MHRLGVAPESPDWYRIAGRWVETTSREVARAERAARNIDDSAAQEWMRGGAAIDLRRPTLRVNLPDDE